jgi:hypothetical protein
MKNDFDIKPSVKYSHRFGDIAVDMGFVTAEQVKEAIAEQIDNDMNNRRHMFIGEIMLMKGWINIKQLDIVLNELYKNEKVNQKVSF